VLLETNHEKKQSGDSGQRFVNYTICCGLQQVLAASVRRRPSWSAQRRGLPAPHSDR